MDDELRKDNEPKVGDSAKSERFGRIQLTARNCEICSAKRLRHIGSEDEPYRKNGGGQCIDIDVFPKTR